MLRITGGVWKGLVLAAPRTLRATEAKVRQALFNILGQAIEGARVLDGFAGSGALGLEALSRGAAFAAFVEADTEAVLCIRQNLDRLGQDLPRGAWRILHLELERGLRQLSAAELPFDLICFDPPYRSDDGRKALNALGEYAILAPAGIVAIEHHRRTELPASVGTLHQWKQHRYGDTVLSFYRVP
ncbi:MAG: 16S rRNA (guanine(966)-N(2))-methyltransferase RsmD [Omnitrophica WOR_2 bacterium RIFCSPHIGHO2_02_FULL_67_20]|nr:MAG: 16S rRNA (guanine(966)-N(2))-methyltransferase RsmD [Omnitrophica WOR_2 bacterium RIFCSPHIGHO2_02_FULL_67_20]